MFLIVVSFFENQPKKDEKDKGKTRKVIQLPFPSWCSTKKNTGLSRFNGHQISKSLEITKIR